MKAMVQADTGRGPVLGADDGQVRSWLGIPYGRADRFGAPQSPDRWPEPKPCLQYGAQAVQNMAETMKQAKLEAPEFSEDCLHLNVWAPAGAASSPRPVLVWIHGGAFIGGASNLFDGSEFARDHGIVVVSVNYRLGVFGFVNFGDALDDPGMPGNLGLRDQMAALQWVHDNIASFGGDPGKVTISGESAGSTSVSLLMMHRPSWALFRGAILQSGGPTLVLDRQTSIRIARRYLEILGIGPDDRERLFDLPAETLMRVQCQVFAEEGAGLPAAPWWDDELLPASMDAARQAPCAPVPVIAGATHDEIRFFELPVIPPCLPTRWDEIEHALAQGLEAERRETVLKAYPRTEDGRRMLATDLAFRMPTQNFAERQSGRAPTWFYRFDYRHPVVGASHLLDTAFLWPYRGLFALVCRGGPMWGRRKALADRMKAHWASFVTHGFPGPDWPNYTPASRSVKCFGPVDRVLNDPDAERRRAWDGADTQVQF